ncbi:sensor histidine kinase [Gemella cuniculi]|uniref:sensor histidine kinase n=1 Tax=Gemella cuniculi TaxID=150240 RepID=UPI00146A5D11|nr:GHKL domain-containing protein [Gemella cuniculi]
MGVYYLALSSVLGLCILFLIISNILRENLKVSFKNKLENEKIIQQKKHIESLEENNNEIRKFKHDFTNIMLSLSGYINSEEIDVIALKKYFNSHVLSLKEKIDVTNSTALSHLGNIKNKPLKSLITNKILIALNYNIDIEINIENKISNVFTQEIQLTRIVGILLDNAIEACRELNTDRIIKINILRINKTIDISITNTFNNENFSIGKFQKNGFSTKGKNRGLGLSIAKEIVSKYNLLLNTEIYNNFFTQNLTIEGDFYENNNMRR